MVEDSYNEAQSRLLETERLSGLHLEFDDVLGFGF
jgi:hypothetical protein